MNGDYTKVPLRRDERWTGARMQEGRVLLDHDWNLNRDAAARATGELAADAIGPAGVVVGSDAFKVGVTTAGTLDLTVQPGRMWVGGLAAFAPGPFDLLRPGPDRGAAGERQRPGVPRRLRGARPAGRGSARPHRPGARADRQRRAHARRLPRPRRADAPRARARRHGRA